MNGHVRVQGSHDPDEMGLEFSWDMELGDGMAQPGKVALLIRAIAYSDFHKVGGTPSMEVEWGFGNTSADDEAAEDVGLRLIALIQKAGRWKGPGTLDWPFALGNLQRALDWAIRSRRRDEGTDILQGALREMVGEEWAITEVGLECPTRQYVFPGKDFPNRNLTRIGRVREERWEHVAPDWVDDDLWRRLVERGRRIFPISPLVSTMMRSSCPFTHSPAEIRNT